jgi:non-homologous end joining protein Ku
MTSDYQVIDRVSRATGKHLEETDVVTAWDEEYEQVLVLEEQDGD